MTHKILNPKLIQVECDKTVDLFKLNMAVFLAPACTFWTCVFLPFTKGKKWTYKKAKELGNAFGDL